MMLRSGTRLRRFIVVRTTGSGTTPRALAWRYAVENLGVEARHYDGRLGAYDLCELDRCRWRTIRLHSETRDGQQEGFQDRIWNAEYSNVPDSQLPLTREWYESSEGFGQATDPCAVDLRWG